MSEQVESIPTVDVTLQAIATQVAGDFIHRLAPAFRPPARLVCPSDEAEQAILEAVTQAAIARGILVEVIDVRPAPAERLDAVTARLGTWGSETDDSDSVPTLLIAVSTCSGTISTTGPPIRSDPNSSSTGSSFGFSSAATPHACGSCAAATNGRFIT